MKKSISFLTLAILTLLFSPAFSKTDPTGNLAADPGLAKFKSHAMSSNEVFFNNYAPGGAQGDCADCNRSNALLTENTAAVGEDGSGSMNNPAGTDGGGKTGP